MVLAERDGLADGSAVNGREDYFEVKTAMFRCGETQVIRTSSNFIRCRCHRFRLIIHLAEYLSLLKKKKVIVMFTEILF